MSAVTDSDALMNSILNEEIQRRTALRNPSAPKELSGGLNNYYLVEVKHPQRIGQVPYTAECEDLIEGLQLDPNEANIFKEIWRSANARLGNGKLDHKLKYGAEKIVHYAQRNMRKFTLNQESK